MLFSQRYPHMRFYRIFFLFSVLLFSTQPLFAAQSPWPMHRQNAQHTGWTNTSVVGLKGNPVAKWVFPAGALIRSSPAIGADGTIYFGSEDKNMYAITNGKVKWSHSSGGGGSAGYFDASPSIGADGTVYVSANNTFYAFTNGIVKYSNSLNYTYATPAIGADGIVYLTTWGGPVFAITNGVIKWSNNSVGQSTSSPAIGSDNTLYFGSLNHYFYALTNGVIKWSFLTGNQIDQSSPVIGSNGTVYIGSLDKNIYAITNGHEKWHFQTGGAIYSTPAIGPDGTIYVGSYDHKLYAINPNTGASNWSFTTGNKINSSPAIDAGGTVYAASEDGKLYAITNGKLKWAFTTSNANAISFSSPAIGADGTIYFGDSGGHFYAIAEGPTPPPTWKSLNGTSTSTVQLAWHINGNVTSQTLYRSLYSASNNTGAMTKFSISTTNHPDTGLSPNTQYYYWLKTCFNGKTSSFSSMGSARTWMTKAPWPMKGQNIRHTGQTNMNVRGVRGNPVAKWTYPTSYTILSSPAIGFDNTIYFADVDGTSQGYLYSITNGNAKKVAVSIKGADASPAIGPDGTVYIGSRYATQNIWAITNGFVKWNCGTGTEINSSPVIGADGTIYIGSRDNKFYAITNGSIKWSTNLGEGAIMSSPTIGPDGTIYIGAKSLYAFTSTGSNLWKSQPTGGISFSSPAIGSDGTIYIGSSDSNLYAFTSRGSNKWQCKTGGMIDISSPAIGPDKTIYVGSQDCKLYAIVDNGLNSYSIKWTNRTGAKITSSPSIDSEGTVYIGSYDGNVYAITNGKVKWSYSTGSTINYSSPAIGNDGTIYIGAENKFLHAIGEGALQPSIISHASATNKISLSWRAVSGVSSTTSFTLFCSTNNSLGSITNTSSRIRGFSSAETNFTITNLLKATKYYCILRSYNSLAPSLLAGAVLSNRTFAIKPFAPVLYPPDVLSSSSLGVLWQPLDNTTAFSLYRNTSSSTSGIVRLSTFSSNTFNYTDTAGLAPNTKYFYFLKAINAMGSSPFSSPVSNTTLAGPAVFSFNPSLPYVGSKTNFFATNKNLIGSRTVKGYFYTWDMTQILLHPTPNHGQTGLLRVIQDK